MRQTFSAAGRDEGGGLASGVPRVASVAYFNAKPLIEGLASVAGVELALRVPSGLADELRGPADVALLPVIDYQRLTAEGHGLDLLPSAGGIGCDGPTLTVRLYAKRPVSGCRVLCCDPHSHTSVVLARVLLKRVYGVEPEVRRLDGATGADDEVRLLIGDKVITAPPADMPHQVDLGGAWKRHTGLPFVFACWTARRDRDIGDLPAVLADCRRRGLAKVEALIAEHAVPGGWPADVARRYVTEYLNYEVGDRQLEAIRLYHRWAAEDGLIETGHPLTCR